MINKQISVLVNDIDQEKPNALANLHGYIQKTIAKSFCTNCNKITDPTTYKNQIDADEYYISGLCDECQVIFFKVDE